MTTPTDPTAEQWHALVAELHITTALIDQALRTVRRARGKRGTGRGKGGACG